MTRKLHRVAELAAYKRGELKPEGSEEDKDRYLRLAAEFDNFKKRAARQYADVVERANDDLLMDILGIIDDFERALNSGSPEKSEKNAGGNGNFIKGMTLIYEKLLTALKNRKVVPMEALGRPFDPVYHEAIMQAPSEKDEGTVIEVVSPGYMIGDRVLRHAKVVVAS